MKALTCIDQTQQRQEVPVKLAPQTSGLQRRNVGVVLVPRRELQADVERAEVTMDGGRRVHRLLLVRVRPVRRLLLRRSRPVLECFKFGHCALSTCLPDSLRLH